MHTFVVYARNARLNGESTPGSGTVVASIETAIVQGFSVCVDARATRYGASWLIDLLPHIMDETITEEEALRVLRRPQVLVKAKNTHMAWWCAVHDVHVFMHTYDESAAESNECVFTSKGYIYACPNNSVPWTRRHIVDTEIYSPDINLSVACTAGAVITDHAVAWKQSLQDIPV